MDQRNLNNNKLQHLCRVALVVLAWLLGSCASNSPLSMATINDDRLILINVDLPEVAQVTVGIGGKSYAGSGYNVPLAATQTLAAVARDYRLERIESWPIAALSLHCGLVRVAANENVDVVLAQLQKDARVKLAQRVNRFEALGSSSAHNDPYFTAQFDDAAPAVAQLHAQHRGKGSSVAIIDTGADVEHPDLKNQITAVRNFVDDDEAQFLRDIHGTAIAGIVAAEADNARGIVGIAPDAQLQILKACWQVNGSGTAACNTFTLAKALAFVYDTQPDVVNLSLAGPSDPLLSQLVERIVAQGSMVVGAVSPRAEKSFPTEVPGVVAVSQIPVADASVVVAPGSERLSTRPRDAYDFFSGNSMAAAYVSGVVALLRADNPALSAAELNEAVRARNKYCVVQNLLPAASASVGNCP